MKIMEFLVNSTVILGSGGIMPIVEKDYKLCKAEYGSTGVNFRFRVTVAHNDSKLSNSLPLMRDVMTI